MKWSKLGLSLTLGMTFGVISAQLDGKRNKNKHASNTLFDKLKALDRRIYLDGKQHADKLERIKNSLDKK